MTTTRELFDTDPIMASTRVTRDGRTTMKARKSYQGLGESRAAVTPRNRLGLLPYHACAVCFGVFDHTPAGRREAVECCSEHKAGA